MSIACSVALALEPAWSRLRTPVFSLRAISCHLRAHTMTVSEKLWTFWTQTHSISHIARPSAYCVDLDQIQSSPHATLTEPRFLAFNRHTPRTASPPKQITSPFIPLCTSSPADLLLLFYLDSFHGLPSVEAHQLRPSETA